jgi:hypothetical protein
MVDFLSLIKSVTSICFIPNKGVNVSKGTFIGLYSRKDETDGRIMLERRHLRL